MDDIEGYLKDNTVKNGRIKDVSKHSPFIEYEFKFKKIPEKLHTQKAKEIAVERLQYMTKYFNRLKSEMKGER